MLIGRKFEQEGKVLDLSSDYYKGEYLGKEETKELMKRAYSIIAIGTDSVGCCLEEGLIEEGRYIKIKDVPFAQILLS